MKQATPRVEYVITVDALDRPVGSAEKLEAHREGLLHRAVSVFVFCPNGRLLLQRRARGKYHCGSLWSNTCCGHPRPNESTAEVAHRRLDEEMGFSCKLWPVFSFTYRAPLRNGLTEHEIDHVFVGVFDGSPHPSPSEVQDWRWIPADDLTDELACHSDRYTPWLRLAWKEFHQRDVLSSIHRPGTSEQGAASVAR